MHYYLLDSTDHMKLKLKTFFPFVKKNGIPMKSMVKINPLIHCFKHVGDDNFFSFNDLCAEIKYNFCS